MQRVKAVGMSGGVVGTRSGRGRIGSGRGTGRGAVVAAAGAVFVAHSACAAVIFTGAAAGQQSRRAEHDEESFHR